MATYRPGDRVEWNPTVGQWLPATISRVDGAVHIVLHYGGQVMQVPPESIRPAPLVGDARHEVEATAAVPDTAETGESLLSAAEAVQSANRSRLEGLARDLESVPDPALKMRVAELVAHREQCCAGEYVGYIDWNLADLRWVLARRAESAGSIPQGDGTDEGGDDG